MVNKHGLSLFFVLFFNAPPTSANCPLGENKTVVFFSNGMFNDRQDAQDSLNALRLKLPEKYTDYDVAYNLNETSLLQLLEVFEQKVGSEKHFLWSYFSKMGGPQWFSEIMREKAKSISATQYMRDVDLRNHVNLYKKRLEAGLAVITVSHSQGNFYANRSFEYIANETENIVGRMRIVGVAVPDANLSGTVDYRTLESDFVIRAIPHAPPHNVANITHGFFDHQFIEHYLQGNPSGTEIIKIIQDETHNLRNADYFFDPGYLHSSLEPMNKWMWRYQKSPKSFKLTKPQCLAISLFIKMENYFGETCEKRDISLIKNMGRECLREQWSDPHRFAFDCGLYGLPSNLGAIERSPPLELLLLNNKACLWNAATVHKELTSEVLNKAFEFIENPIQ